MRKAAVLAAAVASISAFAMAGSAAAAAHQASSTRPSATFSFAHEKVKAGTKPAVTYGSAHLPSRAVIYLQRQSSASGAWKNVLRLKAHAGKAIAPAVKIGRYAYRIRVVKHNHTVVISASHYLYAYGAVAYIQLCSDSENVGGLFCQDGTVQIGSTAFDYVEEENSGYTYPNWYHMDTLGSTSCDHITLTFGTTDTTSGDKAYTELVQSHASPQEASAPIDTLGRLKGKLNGGPLIVNVSETNGSQVFLNGSATCYTSSGLPPAKH